MHLFTLDRARLAVHLLPVFMLSYVSHILTPAPYIIHRHEIDNDLLISLSEKKNEKPNKLISKNAELFL